MAYADLNALKARAGRLAPAWGDATDPDEADLERFLDEVSARVDVELGAKGVAVPVDDATAVTMLGGVVADGALVMAIEATWPGSEAPADAARLLEGARGRWDGWLAAVREGSGPLVEYLMASDPSGASDPLASSFWVEEPNYPYTGLEHDVSYPLTAPEAYRGQRY